jgi:hypothetical protein
VWGRRLERDQHRGRTRTDRPNWLRVDAVHDHDRDDDHQHDDDARGVR